MRQIGGRYSDYGIAAIFVNIRVQKSKIRYKLACKRICDFGTLMLNKICEFGWHHEQFGGCRISKYFCWAAALLSAQNGIEISYGSDAIL